MRQTGTKQELIHGQLVTVKVYATSKAKASPQVRKALRPESDVTVTYEPEEAAIDYANLPEELRRKYEPK